MVVPGSGLLLTTASLTESGELSIFCRWTVRTRLGTAAPLQSVILTLTGMVLPSLKLLRCAPRLIGCKMPLEMYENVIGLVALLTELPEPPSSSLTVTVMPYGPPAA